MHSDSSDTHGVAEAPKSDGSLCNLGFNQSLAERDELIKQAALLRERGVETSDPYYLTAVCNDLVETLKSHQEEIHRLRAQLETKETGSDASLTPPKPNQEITIPPLSLPSRETEGPMPG